VPTSYGGQRRAGTDALILREPRVPFVDEGRPKAQTEASGIRALTGPLGQLGHEAKAASSDRTPVGSHRCG
jgi:hypothetical protein